MVICDKLDHASIVDGCRLSRANFIRYRHNDMDDLERHLRSANSAGRKLVVVDAVFSMDGDVVNLPDVTMLCEKYGAILMVDEAHSIGVLGDTGHGVREYFGSLPSNIEVIKTGSLSKAIPSVGGYVAGTRELCDRLSHQARGFVYSASAAPSATAAALSALQVIEDEPEKVRQLHDNTYYFGQILSSLGLQFHNHRTPIFPIMCGDELQTLKLARYCQRHGIYVQAIIHPVVPKGTARLRAAVGAAHSSKQLDHCATVLREAAHVVGVSWQHDCAPQSVL